MLRTVSLVAKSQILRPVVPQVLPDALSMLHLVGARIGARANRLVVLDAEVDARDGVFTRHDSNLMRGFILEARRR